MDSRRVTISMPVNMLRRIDEAAAISYQTRSNFIRMAIVEKFGAKSQYDLVVDYEPDMRTDKQTAKMYDFQEEYEEAMADLEPEVD